LFSAGANDRGALAGNGGKMAAIKKTPLETEKADDETGSATKKKTGESAGRKKAARKDGAEQLRWAADRRVGTNSNKLANLLLQKALEGDLASAKVLLSLAEGKKPIPEVKGPFRSLALRLAAEPQQPRVWQEGAAETSWGGAGRERGDWGSGNRD
jgi:hypothetical protein